MKGCVQNNSIADYFVEYTGKLNKDLHKEGQNLRHQLFDQLKIISDTDDCEKGISLKICRLIERILEPIELPKQNTLLGKGTRDEERGYET